MPLMDAPPRDVFWHRLCLLNIYATICYVHDIVLYVASRFRYNLLVLFSSRNGEIRIKNLTLARYVPTPENGSALVAVRSVAAKQSDLFVVEDVHRLVRRRPDDSGHCVAEMLVQLFDYLYARHRQLVFTATVGPRGLAQLPARLVSRLSCGLVVGLQPMQAASRLALLQDKAQ